MPGDSVTPCSYVPKNPQNHENQHFLQSHWFSLHHSVCEKAKKWKKYHPDHSQRHSACDQLIILEMGGFHTTGLVLRHLVFLTLCVCVLMCVLCYFMLYTHPFMRNMWHEAEMEIYNGIWYLALGKGRHWGSRKTTTHSPLSFLRQCLCCLFLMIGCTRLTERRTFQWWTHTEARES